MIGLDLILRRKKQ
ncbi:unnamed protein product [Leptidea sinapis]|uniref:Uncharacterized protein n=1 Tax=Leptidea sinapis TaxID=189913 RepID=A0A5E4QLT5_9NEOP|nr:unnamed protein product [Leptidea sinapis]